MSLSIQSLSPRYRMSLTVIVFALAALTLKLTPVHGQTGASAPVATPVAATVRSAPVQQAPATITTLHEKANLVVVDVVVTDAKKNPIHGLQRSDFTLTENGKPQTIRAFEEHTALPASETSKIAPLPKLPAGLFTNRTAVPANGPANVLLLDYLNTPLIAQASAKKQLIQYLDQAPAGTRIAIFGLTTHLVMLQGFTSDMSVLKAALTAKKGNPDASVLLSDNVAGGVQGGTPFGDSLAAAGGTEDASISQEMVDDINRVDAQLSSESQDARMKYTLDSFDQLARYLVGIPGRKNVIWYSGSFPLDVEPNVNEADPNDSVIRNDDEVRKTDNMLTRAQVAMYPVDARGLQVDPTNSVTNMAATSEDPTGMAAATGTLAFLSQTAQEHETMDAMAEDTGGEAFFNTNGLTQAVSKAIEEGSNYYTLTYSPNDMQWDERFRTIKIKVAEQDAKLTYRNGYFAVDPNDRNRNKAADAATALIATNTMSAAMMHGGPTPEEIVFQARIRPSNAPLITEVLASNQSNPTIKIDGPFRQYSVDLVPSARSVSCADGDDGNYHCAIEVWTFVYDTNGNKLITASNRVHSRLTPTEYSRLQAGGLAFHQQISVPVKGRYYIRTAIHDMVSDNVGAIELPVGAVANLAPLQQLAQTPVAPDAKATPTAPSTTPSPTGAVATP